jgi:uncharacterized iron-regulated membrane protein
MEDFPQPTHNPENSGSLASAQLPLALLALAFCVFLFSQISNLGQNSRAMQWQSDNLDREIVSLSDSEKRFDELIKQRETLVQQSQQVQSRYTEMLTDLIELAETDADARAVVEKFKIQRQQNQPKADSGDTSPVTP